MKRRIPRRHPARPLPNLTTIRMWRRVRQAMANGPQVTYALIPQAEQEVWRALACATGVPMTMLLGLP